MNVYVYLRLLTILKALCFALAFSLATARHLLFYLICMGLIDFAPVNVSQRSLETILRQARDNGLPSHSSRRTFGRARKSIVKTKTPYGPLVRCLPVSLNGNKEGTLYVQDPCPLLSHCAQKSASFSRLLRRTREKTGDRPWTIVLYNDEVSPTNPKKKHGQPQDRSFLLEF